MRVLLVRCNHRPFEVERFGGAWTRAAGRPEELLGITPDNAKDIVRSEVEVAGLLLTGGPDMEPRRYGQRPATGVELSLDPARDALDLELLDEAQRRLWPVLAVCYGCQVLNVFHGGTLIQDLERAGISGHRVGEPKDHLAHEVTLVGGGGRWLAGLPSSFKVNSRHHQALGSVAAPLTVVAQAPDGVVEAVELRDAERFVLGVQWHPENLHQREHVEVFRRFRAACLTRSRPGP